MDLEFWSELTFVLNFIHSDISWLSYGFAFLIEFSIMKISSISITPYLSGFFNFGAILQGEL
jgi:hypothetical protein